MLKEGRTDYIFLCARYENTPIIYKGITGASTTDKIIFCLY